MFAVQAACNRDRRLADEPHLFAARIDRFITEGRKGPYQDME
jgi:hypothetical protein